MVDVPAQGGASGDASGGRPDAPTGAPAMGAWMQARGAPAEAPHALQAWQGRIHVRTSTASMGLPLPAVRVPRADPLPAGRGWTGS